MERKNAKNPDMLHVDAQFEDFCRFMALGGCTAFEAYEKLQNVRIPLPGPKLKALRSSLDRYADNSNVRNRIYELRKTFMQETVNQPLKPWTVSESVEKLRETFELAKTLQNPAGMVAPIKELNAMYGFNAPKKHQLVGDDGKSIQPVMINILSVASNHAPRKEKVIEQEPLSESEKLELNEIQFPDNVENIESAMSKLQKHSKVVDSEDTDE